MYIIIVMYSDVNFYSVATESVTSEQNYADVSYKNTSAYYNGIIHFYFLQQRQSYCAAIHTDVVTGHT